MSTYLFLLCLDHTPPLEAEGESGQHLYDLPQIRADVANREQVVSAWDGYWGPGHHFRHNTARFLAPIRELHREQFQFCRDCDADYPSRTVRLLDQIEAGSKGGE